MEHEDTEIEQLEIPEVTLFYEFYTIYHVEKDRSGLALYLQHQTLMGKCGIYSVYEFFFQP